MNNLRKLSAPTIASSVLAMAGILDLVFRIICSNLFTGEPAVGAWILLGYPNLIFCIPGLILAIIGMTISRKLLNFLLLILNFLLIFWLPISWWIILGITDIP